MSYNQIKKFPQQYHLTLRFTQSQELVVRRYVESNE